MKEKELLSYELRILFRRFIASSSDFMSIAIEILKWPSIPNALPGTTATFAFSSKYNASSVSFEI